VKADSQVPRNPPLVIASAVGQHFETIHVIQIVLSVIIIILGACTSKISINDSMVNNPKEISNDSILIENDFKAFWNEFRKAVIQEDTLKLIELTNFPLKSHGMLDEDPQIIITKEKYFFYLNKYLHESTGMSFEKETNLDYIKRNAVLEKNRNCNMKKKWCRIANLEFEKIGLTWKLSLIYFDTSDRY
jgi:hypothetical protein